MADVILQADGLTKDFGGFRAVNGVSLSVERGTIHALIGPNGAGKTTFFNLLTKFLAPSSGRILYEGKDITARRPSEIANMGIIRSFQISAVFPHLTALENVRVALQRRLGISHRFWQSTRVLEALHDEAREKLAAVGLSQFAETRAVSLASGRKRALEIATTLALDPKLMLLDEPTQGMGTEDVGRVTDLIREVSAGRTILMVEHNLGVVSTLADRITVLNRGQILADGPYETVSRDPAVMEAYMGTTPEEMAHG
ncbi:MAG: ABC transporter ATP-binding protein [Pararhizobium sp.]